MPKHELLLDLLDAWDELPTIQRPSPAEFCAEHPELIEDFCQILRSRSALGAAISGSGDVESTPQAMMDSITPDRYGLLHFHDQGGIGWVYVAKDSEVDRKVALKCLKPQAAIDPEARSRFFREAAITSTLEHPGIVPVYGVGGKAADELPYYAMRFVQGTTMKDAIRQLHSGSIEKWSTGLAYQLLRSLINVCDTVSFAHSRNIVHRDLKSGNIMLGEYGETLVLDWGLAKKLREAERGPSKEIAPDFSSDALQATRTGSTIGTIAFMSPEQALGNWIKVDFQSDQFSLGAILYQILTGQVPYHGPNSLTFAQRAEYVPPISLLAATPPALNAICCKAMAADKSNRYASVEAFKKDLENYLADEPIIALPDHVIASTQRWFRKHRALAQITSFLVMVTFLILVGFLAQLTRQNQQLERAIENEKQAKTEVEEGSRRIKALLVESQSDAYQAQMSILSQSWNAMHPKRLEQAIFNAQPKVGSLIDPRGPEWWIAWYRVFGDITPIVLDYGEDPIVALRLVADSQRVAIWTRSRRLVVLDMKTKVELFSGTMLTPANMLSIRSTDDIPISEDGSTIAIADREFIQLWKWDGKTYVKQNSPLRHATYNSTWRQVCLSRNGETLAALNQSNEVAIWKQGNIEIKLPFDNFRAEKISIADDGAMVALLKEKSVAIVRLDTEELKEFQDISKDGPTKIAFGDLNTLIAWNKQSARTWYIHLATFDAVQLWDYPLPPPPKGAFEWDCLREKIVFENGFRVDRVGAVPDVLVDPGRVRTSMLACIGDTDSRVLVREPAKSFALLDDLPNPNLLNDRIRELPVPHTSQIRSIAVNFKSAIVNYAENQWGYWNMENQIQSWNDPFQYRGPVSQVSWPSDKELIGVSAAASFPPFVVHGPGELTAPEIAVVHSNTMISNPRSIQLKGYQSCISENGRVAASYDKKAGIHIVDLRTQETKQPFEVDSTLTFIGDRAIQMYLWNRWEQNAVSTTNQPEVDFEIVAGKRSQEVSRPLDLPWLLMFQNGSWGDPMSGSPEERLRLLIIDYQKRTQVDVLEIDDDKIQAVTISSDGRNLIVATEGKKLHTWEIGDDRKIVKRSTIDLPRVVKSIYVQTPFQAYMGTESGDILHLNAENQIEEWIGDAHDGSVNSISISPDQSRLVTLGSDKLVRMFAIEDRREVLALAMNDQPTAVSFSPQQRCLAVGDTTGRIAIFPLATSDQVIEFERQVIGSKLNRGRSEESIARELWAGGRVLSSQEDIKLDACRNAIDTLRPRFTELSLPELRGKIVEAIQLTP